MAALSTIHDVTGRRLVSSIYSLDIYEGKGLRGYKELSGRWQGSSVRAMNSSNPIWSMKKKLMISTGSMCRIRGSWAIGNGTGRGCKKLVRLGLGFVQGAKP
jgi:hypothetical protein